MPLTQTIGIVVEAWCTLITGDPSKVEVTLTLSIFFTIVILRARALAVASWRVKQKKLTVFTEIFLCISLNGLLVLKWNFFAEIHNKYIRNRNQIQFHPSILYFTVNKYFIQIGFSRG